MRVNVGKVNDQNKKKEPNTIREKKFHEIEVNEDQEAEAEVRRREATVAAKVKLNKHQDHSASSTKKMFKIKESWETQAVKVNLNDVMNEVCESENEIEWLLDSGYTAHIINNQDYFCKYVDLRTPIDVKLPDRKNLRATKLGTVKIIFKTYYNEVQVELKNVYFVESIKRKLLSLSKITENSTIVSREQNAKIYNKNKKLIALADKINGLYIMKSFLHNNEKSNIYANAETLTDKEKWHKALGHVNY